MSEPADQPEIDEPRTTLRQHLRNWFLTGIVVAAPVLITGYLVSTIVGAIDEQITPLLPPEIRKLALPGIGLLIVVVGLTLLGAVTANVIGRWLLAGWEILLNRTPVIRAIYRPVKQVFETVIGPGGMSFREVVLVEYPSPGLWVIGFVTAPAPADVARTMGGEEVVSVYLPTAPNLYAGYLLFQPRSRLKPLKMDVDEAVRLVVSAGIAGQPVPAAKPGKRAS